MDQHAEVTEFLKTRRDKITPQEVGLIAGARRRVPGLRREEVALLAGVSVEYYARMERGDLAGVSPEVLDSLARALELDDAEYDHLADLARAAGPRPVRRRKVTGPAVPETLQQFLDAVTGSPMWVRDIGMDFIAANSLGRALYSPVVNSASAHGNIARFTFFDPAAHTFFPEWDDVSEGCVATLRSYAGRFPRNKKLTDLVGELVTRSDDFCERWARHDVRHHRAGIKRLHHPEVGDLELNYQGMTLPEHPQLFMFAYTAAPGSISDERLKLLGSLVATREAEAARVSERQPG